GVLAGTVVLSLGNDPQSSRRVDADVNQLINRIELARHFALQRNREWGLSIDPTEIRFVEWDPATGRWITQRKAPFKPIPAAESLPFRLQEAGERLKKERVERSQEGQTEVPDVILFSSGETTPFTLMIGGSGERAARTIQSDGLSRVTSMTPAT
ncbi:MAG: pilus assembly FimT family protein, partial [Pseudomonadales bacterium]